MENEKVKENPKLEQNKEEEPMSTMMKVILIGFFGGLIWSGLGYLAAIFSFTDIKPSMVLQPWAVGEWKTSVLGEFISIGVLSVLSVFVAILFFFTLKKWEKVWVGLLFGLVIWGIVFFVLNPIFPDLDPVPQLGLNTLVTTICLYALYGVFVGYSISYEYNQFGGGKQAN